MQQKELQEIFEKFAISDKFLEANPFGNGHINDTFLVATSNSKYILQRLNHHVFKNIEKMNQNIISALTHFDKQDNLSETKRFRKLEISLTNEGKSYFLDKNGSFWRVMNFVDNSISFDVTAKPEIAYQAAKAFGYFQKQIIELNPDNFFPVIEDFHNLEMRLKTFEKVLAENAQNRNNLANAEIEIVESHRDISEKLTQLLDTKKIPIRVTHNDTKINNVLLDKDSLEGIAVIDLDTIMPGTILFDFGDMIRTFSSPAAEDEVDLSKVVLRKDIFKAMAKGYISELKDVLTKSEIDNLVFGGKILTFMIGLRFLTDFLEGDIYYKTSKKNHNLIRCRTQFKLLHEIEQNELELNSIIKDEI